MSSLDAELIEPAIAAADLTAFQQYILTILAEESRYGLAIKRELEDLYGDEVNHGRLYPNLDDLVEQGYLEKGELDKRTNEYALTDEGRAVVTGLVAWRAGKLDVCIESTADRDGREARR